MSKVELTKRYILFIISLFFAGFGVAITSYGELGVSPLASVPNVLSIEFKSISLGTFVIAWNLVMILAQILILRKNFKLIQFLQIPISFLFGWFTDLGLFIISHVPIDSYASRMGMVILGIVVLGFGISLAVIANVIMNSGEALVLAISETLHANFGNVKIAFDVTCVTISIVLSLIFFHMSIVGTREGTVIAALTTGLTVKFFTHFLSKPLNSLLSD